MYLKNIFLTSFDFVSAAVKEFVWKIKCKLGFTESVKGFRNISEKLFEGR